MGVRRHASVSPSSHAAARPDRTELERASSAHTRRSNPGKRLVVADQPAERKYPRV